MATGRKTRAAAARVEKTAAQHYIFGYGSLIEDESRERSTASARYAFPAVVSGILRGW